MTVQSRHGTRVFDEGAKIEIAIKDVDFVRLQVILEIVDRSVRR